MIRAMLNGRVPVVAEWEEVVSGLSGREQGE